MNGKSSSQPSTGDVHPIRGILLIPLSLLPLLALVTYDWRAISYLHSPPAASTNCVGLVGDMFAYWGYHTLGLAVWSIPALCIVWAFRRTLGRPRRGGLAHHLWEATAVVALACLVDSVQGSAPGIATVLERLNIAGTGGGVVGYLVMSCTLTPLFDAAATVLVLCTLAVSAFGAIGFSNVTSALGALVRWARYGSAAPADEPNAEVRRIAEDAERIIEERAQDEKQRLKAERQRAKEEKKAREEAARAQIEADRAEAARKRSDGERKSLLETAARLNGARSAEKAAKADNVEKAAAAGGGEAGEKVEKSSDKGPYVLPPLSLLNPMPKSTADHGDVGEMSKKLVATLALFGIDANVAYTVCGPVVTKYAVELSPGTRYSAVTGISDNLMGALRARSLRIESPIPGEDCVGIEVPNLKPAGISFREVIESKAWTDAGAALPLLFGKDAAGNDLVADLATMPHLLVAGATGQGKSVCLNAIISGFLMSRTPEELKLIMVDPKSVEFTAYQSIPHLLVPVITDNRKVTYSLNWAVVEMEKRLKLFASAHVRNIYDFNHRPGVTQPDLLGGPDKIGDMPRTVPYIVIIIDEVADLMATSAKEVVPSIARLTAKARAAGIHLILATQRPDAKVITGTIKANIPGRVAFKCSTGVDSRTILDAAGAENLIGRGDMLFRTKDGQLIRAQGAWISDPEIGRITDFIAEHADVQFDEKFAAKLSRVKEAAPEDALDDGEGGGGDGGGAAQPTRQQVKASEDADLYKRALEVVINMKRASTSLFQRQLGVGYNHAAKIIEKMEAEGIVAPQRGAGPREILFTQEQLMAMFDDGAGAPSDAAEPAGEDAAAGGEQLSEDNT